VRSHDLHAMRFPRVKAIGRAGRGHQQHSGRRDVARGVPVFNAPGANANAVKELVLTRAAAGARNVVPALRYVRVARPGRADLEAQVEEGKKQFAGVELRSARSASSASARSAASSPTPRSSSA
jgi:D-3-phosphoglycerate dehydrogenase